MGFKGGATDWRKAVLTEQLEANLVSWLSRSLLEAGAYETVARGAQDARGGDRSRLTADPDPRYAAGTRWAGKRGQWVWEGGTGYSPAPLVPSGVWVNGAFRPTGAPGPYVDFARGQVVFSSGLPTGTVVQVDHSPRLVQVYRADEPWFKEFGFNSFLADGGGKAQQALAENRVQLPLLLVEPAFNVVFTPREIGNYAGSYRTDFLVHALSENPWDRKRLHDILVAQADLRIPTFDANAAPPPLDALGRPTPSALTHDQLCAAHPWRQARVETVASVPQETGSRKLYWASVRWGLSVDLA